MVTPLFPVTLTDVSVRRRGVTLIGPISLTLESEGTTIVMGPNGSGKTTLLRTLHGLARLSKGRIEWGVPWGEARRRQAFVFQQPVMLRRGVLDNIAFPLRLGGVPRRAARSRAKEWAERVGLGHTVGRQAEVLSGGERQKLAIARALIREPDVLLLDEPTASLDGRSTREIESILTETADRGTRIIMATHDMGQAKRLSHDVVFLLHGAVCAHQAAPEFFERPVAEQAGAFVRGDIVE